MVDFVAAPTDGSRQFRMSRPVRLADAAPDGRMRPDAVARLLQDVASDDWADTGVTSEDTWLVRRTALRLRAGGRWPTLGDMVTATTWCGGSGAAWAERRTDLAIGGETVLETVALWVPVGRSGMPVRVGVEFYSAYGPSARRRVTSRTPTHPVPPEASRRRWSVRWADLDVVGHANNAALWTPLSELAPAGIRSASVTYVGGVEYGDSLDLVHDQGRWWLVVDDVVRVAGTYDLEGTGGSARREDATDQDQRETEHDAEGERLA